VQFHILSGAASLADSHRPNLKYLGPILKEIRPKIQVLQNLCGTLCREENQGVYKSVCYAKTFEIVVNNL
jgi:hypothetical protein